MTGLVDTKKLPIKNDMLDARCAYFAAERWKYLNTTSHIKPAAADAKCHSRPRVRLIPDQRGEMISAPRMRLTPECRRIVLLPTATLVGHSLDLQGPPSYRSYSFLDLSFDLS